MKPRIRKTSLALLLTALTAGAAHAAITTNEQRERSSALTAKISLAQAIQNAEAKEHGKAVYAGLEYDHDKNFYEISLVTGDARERISVDSMNGNVIDTETGMRGHRGDKAVTMGALARAVMSAEQAASGGKAVEAKYVDTDEVTRIQVEIARSADSTQMIEVDAATGRVLSVGETRGEGYRSSEAHPHTAKNPG